MLAFLLVLGLASPGENAPEILQKQTQELVDAISTGTAAVWDRYLDPEVCYIDESGTVLRKKQLLEGIRPLPAVFPARSG